LSTSKCACGNIKERLIELGLDLLKQRWLNNDAYTAMKGIKDGYEDGYGCRDLEGIDDGFDEREQGVEYGASLLVLNWAFTNVLKIAWRKVVKIRAWLGTASWTWRVGRGGGGRLALGFLGLQVASVRAFSTIITFKLVLWILGSESTGTGLGQAKKALASGHQKKLR
jgi:hypothetical protein